MWPLTLRSKPNAATESRAMPPITAGFAKLGKASDCDTPRRNAEELDVDDVVLDVVVLVLVVVVVVVDGGATVTISVTYL